MMEELRDLYQEVILDHGKNPRNFGQPEGANCEAHGHNPVCGDMLTVYLTIDGDDVIRDAAFEGRGCAISMASASMMTEVLKGKTLEEAKKLFDGFHQMLHRGRLRPDGVRGRRRGRGRAAASAFRGARVSGSGEMRDPCLAYHAGGGVGRTRMSRRSRRT